MSYFIIWTVFEVTLFVKQTFLTVLLSTGDNEFLTTDVQESISWLNYNKQPWHKVLQLWKETSKARLRAHIGGTESIETYFNTFPALKDKSGFLLVSVLLTSSFYLSDKFCLEIQLSIFSLSLFQFESDFEDMFPNANCFYTQWPILAAFVEKKVNSSVCEEIKDSLTPGNSFFFQGI